MGSTRQRRHRGGGLRRACGDGTSEAIHLGAAKHVVADKVGLADFAALGPVRRENGADKLLLVGAEELGRQPMPVPRPLLAHK